MVGVVMQVFTWVLLVVIRITPRVGDTSVVVTDPNHDPEQKALAVEESLAKLKYYNNNSRSLTGYEVLKENSGVWDVIATTGETMYSDQGLATSTGESYSYKVRATYHWWNIRRYTGGYSSAFCSN